MYKALKYLLSKWNSQEKQHIPNYSLLVEKLGQSHKAKKKKIVSNKKHKKMEIKVEEINNEVWLCSFETCIQDSPPII